METKSWLAKAKSRELLTEESFTTLIEKLHITHLKLNACLKFIGKSANANKAE